MNIAEYKQLTSEHDEAIRLVWYLDQLVESGKVRLYTKIPNETYTTSWAQKRKNKIEGVQPGFPDYVVATGKELVFIEMKRLKGGVVSIYQQQWLAILNNLGLKAVVCKGFVEAETFLKEIV